MDLSQILMVVAGIGLLALYLKIKHQQREIDQMRQLRILNEQKRINEIEAETRRLKEKLIPKKEEFRNGLKIFREFPGGKSDNDDNGGNDSAS